MGEIRVLGILVSERTKAAQQVQEVLTRYGCSVRNRLGLNELELENCKDCGLILLELTGDVNEAIRLENELWSIEGVRVQKMVF